ncbi:CHRD domain-containing protein [Ottowia thiooxydans]|uniref:CHRD domain-containing protein n=1 Tax=Ottowia thiooxydans TaxID=219182 RepID=UPI0003FB081B|nr:CHRD domain-containing protein [Ottowia thiooxydans]
MPMTTASRPSRHALAVLAAACLASACASVDLSKRYDPPPLRLPQPIPSQQPPISPTGVQPQPISGVQPVPQALPPIGAVQPQPQSPPPAPVDSTVVAPVRPDTHLVTLTGQLDGMSVIPATRSNGSGQLDALYDSSTRTLRWKTSWTGLSGAITAVQFHGPADPGQSAPASMIWPGPFGPRYEGRATLTPQQAVDLMDGRWYVNVMTSAYPAGEVRAQLRIVR